MLDYISGEGQQEERRERTQVTTKLGEPSGRFGMGSLPQGLIIACGMLGSKFQFSVSFKSH